MRMIIGSLRKWSSVYIFRLPLSSSMAKVIDKTSVQSGRLLLFLENCRKRYI